MLHYTVISQNTLQYTTADITWHPQHHISLHLRTTSCPAATLNSISFTYLEVGPLELQEDSFPRTQTPNTICLGKKKKKMKHRNQSDVRWFKSGWCKMISYEKLRRGSGVWRCILNNIVNGKGIDTVENLQIYVHETM